MRMSATRSALVVLAVVMASRGVSGQKKTVRMSQEFTYDGRGVGPNPVLNSIALKPNEEDRFVSRSLLDALQQLQFSVAKHDLSATIPLAPNQTHETDIVPLSRDLIASHDAANPRLGLGTDVIYGLQYRVQYAVDTRPRTRSFVIDVTPVVYRRGAASSRWRDYNSDYSSDFFAQRLIQQVSKNLSEAQGVGR
jgi:hypothetical protein